jgi:hypothetical protein
VTAAADARLEAAVLVYLGRDRSPFPTADGAAVRAMGGNALVTRVAGLVGESMSVQVDWEHTGLVDAGRLVAAEMRRRHPHLSPAAVEALAWNVTFAWR